jgi:hypothetical protein
MDHEITLTEGAMNLISMSCELGLSWGRTKLCYCYSKETVPKITVLKP